MISLNEIVRQFPTELRKPEFYDAMLKEYLHHHMLKSLFSGKYAGKISFIGGTALRYFYGLKRFSEDIDLDCHDLSKNEFFEMTAQVEKDILSMGFDVMIEDKKKYEELKAFRRVFVFPGLKSIMGLSQHRDAKFFIKIEAEAQGINYTSDVKRINGFSVTCPVRLMPLDLLFSSKIAAALSRKKHRDFYDVAFLINFASPNFNFLRKKCGIDGPVELKEALLTAAAIRKLEKMKVFDCEHMLFDNKEVEIIRSFSEYIYNFDFTRFTETRE